MKLSLFIPILTNLLIAATAPAAAVDPDFAYDFLNKGKVGLCPGVALRVLTVGAVGGQLSGAGGQMYTQDFFNQDHRITNCMYGHEIERCRTFNPVPRRDVRADVEGMLRGFDFRKQSFGPSLSRLVPEEAALVEQVPVQNGQVSVCMSKLDLLNLNQDRGAGVTVIKFDLGLKYYVSLDTDAGRQTFLVEEVEGRKTVTSAFAEVYADYNPQPLPFLANSWDALQKDLASSLAPVPNAEADQGLAKVASYVGEYIGPRGQE